MRIVFTIGTSTGGVGTHVHALARDLAAAGHEIGVIGPAATDEHFGFSLLPGVRFGVLELGTGVGPSDAALVRRQRTLLRSFSPQIVHAHGFRAGLITLLTLRTLKTRPKFVLSLHNQASGQGLRGRVETRVETMLARGADLVLGASTDLVDRARELGAQAARFLPAAAPEVTQVSAEAAAAKRAALAEEFDFDPGALIVLAVGRVAEQKNYPMLVRGLARLGEERPATTDSSQSRASSTRLGEENHQGEIVALIAGAADEEVLADVRAQYDAAAAASAIPALHFLGPRDDIAELAAAADIYALTSVWEARALVLQEALISGKAIVATATGGSAELVGDAGILIDHDDDAAFAAAVAELAVDPARRAELGARARARGGELPDESEVAEELAGLYTELVPAQVG
ncbi:Glycosyltransferase involved in cell wall bisynthesis [Brevibacterium iodinum ATCC 49514]|uniref:Glycosyltransferase involved in cell wall bisynthesis n=1 Tax=Brevibacterium iodinum ATCC 49514 TaxID=1255616 RepID=A0A2H1JBF8_9MICO|nr:glycosyltransferase family 4 protein [Brevibacterium iodinum]SMX84743.1 Glycosyltransferase involved in cell wall bisynthesis [Brevibacterium iodinum ATCC 49514]SUW12871.1 Glycogen synthase [Brevibacterium iodinum]